MVSTDKPPLWLIFASSALILSGVQAILPVLPAIQRELALSDAQISLLITVYVLPSALFSIPLSVAADRIGRRPVIAWALVLFGLGGLYLLFRHSFPELLVVRALQGLCFAPVIPVGITLIGDHWRGTEQISAQGRRVVAMNLGNAALPAVSGLMGAIAWYAPFAIQTLTIPLGILALRQLPDRPPISSSRTTMSSTIRATARRQLLPIHATAFLRFFFRYALLTYLPILLAKQFSSSATSIGFVVAVIAVAGTVGAASAARLSNRAAPVTLLILGFLGIGMGLLGVATSKIIPLVIVATVIYGLSDGVFTVVHASLLTEAVPTYARASMVGVTGAMKNVGQMVGPSVMGLLTILMVPLGAAFALLGGLSLASAGLARSVRPTESPSPTADVSA